MARHKFISTYFDTCINRIRSVISPPKPCETCKTPEELFGCSMEALAQHLEGQFQKFSLPFHTLCWESYGDWHVDHITPFANFDMENKMHQKWCYHYTNLQPLPACLNYLRKRPIAGTELSFKPIQPEVIFF